MSNTDGPQPSGCISALRPSVSILLTRCLFKDAACFRTHKVVRTLMQPEGCGPSVLLRLNKYGVEDPWNGVRATPKRCVRQLRPGTGWHRSGVHSFTPSPGVSASLRPLATICQPSGLRRPLLIRHSNFELRHYQLSPRFASSLRSAVMSQTCKRRMSALTASRLPSGLSASGSRPVGNMSNGSIVRMS